MMNTENKVCPAEKSWLLSNRIRNLVQPPKKILSNYISKGNKVVDLGCGPGHFSIPMAYMVGSEGSLTCVDLQAAMLDIIQNKILGTEIENRITLHQCEPNRLNLKDTFDFALAFYMVHEVPDKKAFLKEVFNSLNRSGQLLIVEPKGHVKTDEFEDLKDIATSIGFTALEKPKLSFSFSQILIK